MKRSAADLLDAVQLLARCLLTPRAASADLAIAMKRIRIGMIARREIGDEVHWFKVASGGESYFIFAGSNGEGRYSRTLPADANPASVIAIEIDPRNRPVTAILENIGGVIEALAEGKPAKDGNGGEIIEFEGTEDDRRRLPQLLEYASAVRLACEPETNAKILALQSGRFQTALGRFDATNGFSAVFEEMRKLTLETGQLRDGFAIDAETAAWSLIRGTLPDAIFRAMLARGSLEGAAEGERMRYLTFGGTPVPVEGAKERAFDIIRKAAREQMWETAADLGDQWYAEGHALVEEALNAADSQAHQIALYHSAPKFCAAFWIFEALTVPRQLVIPQPYHDRYRASRQEANEDLVRVSDVLRDAFEDRMGAQTALRKQMLAYLHREKGERAARDQLFEWIEMKYTHPRALAATLLPS